MKLRANTLAWSLVLGSLASCQMDAAWLDGLAAALSEPAYHDAASTPARPGITTAQQGPRASSSNPLAAAGALGGAANAGADRADRADGADRDPSLVGSWSRTESMSSGDFSIATQEFLDIRPDGTFSVGTGDMVGGGAMGSLESRGSESVTARWKTESGVVLVGDESGWQPFARYYVEAGSLMFTFADGSRQVWYR